MAPGVVEGVAAHGQVEAQPILSGDCLLPEGRIVTTTKMKDTAVLFFLLLAGTIILNIVVAQDLLPWHLLPVAIIPMCFFAFGAALTLICGIVNFLYGRLSRERHELGRLTGNPLDRR